MSFFHKSGIVNVKMVITEEKILSNIDKIEKLINPNSKKQIIQLEEDSYFKDLVESVKTYLLEYPKKKNFPASVYRASYNLVEYATNQFEENTKRIEELIRNREKNIKLASVLRDATAAVKARAKNWKEIVKKIEAKYPQDVAEALTTIGKCKNKETEEYANAVKLIETRINNLESNLHIEIDMERIEDKSKALSYIGIEIAEALKYIPAPVGEGDTEKAETVNEEADIITEASIEETPEVGENVAAIEKAEGEADVVEETDTAYIEETRFEAKPSLWQKFKNSKFVRTLKMITSVRIRFDVPALPEGKENQ